MSEEEQAYQCYLALLLDSEEMAVYHALLEDRYYRPLDIAYKIAGPELENSSAIREALDMAKRCLPRLRDLGLTEHPKTYHGVSNLWRRVRRK